ncbi:acyl-CoA dehydrogenase family protein [Alloalcanivorax gelatiniphagus]|uniref:Acyl-CoA dehydrogenase n=2 Tax=Alloalcanivorax gelatiniphagus TaxID=1194167 RepID=A0ABY2XM37_9GAMM|nr:acyl-CoA dehydrogenase family protein [Alloalcanivorax gelatiniphagus]TMW13352.1 acyl-CoA dehydrogenase [Alloalcanivorax gelatiniphagus]
MLRAETEAQARWRADIAAWLAHTLPDSLRHLTFRPPPDQAMAWYRTLAAHGWIAPHWPREHGGLGATPVEQVILMEEMARAGAPDLPTQGLNHIGPLLMHRGSEQQRARHLPAILNGDVIWCQGYSEPGAGSDLASLRTKGELDGDTLVINGHKIWTTWGHHADWMFALIRTGKGRRRQEGITFILIDLASPGITRRPITTLAGDDELCEVFFDDVRVPVDQVVGTLNQGWAVATALLDEERLRLGSPALALKALTRLRHLAASAEHRETARGPLRERIARAEVETEAVIAAYLAAAEALDDGRPADCSSLKVLATETVQRTLDTLQRLAGASAALRDPRRDGALTLDYSEMFLQSHRLSIYGGTNEIQRTLIAQKTLNLPTGARS